MSVPVESNPTGKPAAQWNYVDVQVTDGQRTLRPTHIAFDRLIFAEPPGISSQQVEIIITNNGQSHSSHAFVLPHELSATYVPIQLITTEQKPRLKLIA